jgi:hypothetical protein
MTLTEPPTVAQDPDKPWTQAAQHLGFKDAGGLKHYLRDDYEATHPVAIALKDLDIAGLQEELHTGLTNPWLIVLAFNLWHDLAGGPWEEPEDYDQAHTAGDELAEQITTCTSVHTAKKLYQDARGYSWYRVLAAKQWEALSLVRAAKASDLEQLLIVWRAAPEGGCAERLAARKVLELQQVPS